MDQAIWDQIDRHQRETHSEQNESRYTNVVCDRDYTLMQSATAYYPRGLFRETYPGFKCPHCSRFFARENGYVDAKHNGVENLRDDPRCPKGPEQRMYLQRTPEGLYWQCHKCNASKPYLPIEHMTNNEIERQILEAIRRIADEEKRQPQPKNVFSSEMVRAGTPFGHAESSRDEFLDRLDILEHRGFIRQIKHPAAPAVRMIGLAPAGKARLLMDEVEFQSQNRTEVTHTSHTVNVNAPIQNFAHSSGDHSPVIQNVHILNEGDKTASLELIDKIVSELQKHSGTEDAINEAEQLRLEVKRKEPRLDRILGTLKTLCEIGKTAVALMPYLHSLAAHLHIADKLPFLS